jgi:cathepsin L
MRIFIIQVILVYFLIQCTFGLNELFVQHLWNKFKKSHGKTYLSEEHESYRFDIFKRNVDIIEKHNSEYAMGMHKFTLGVNMFADWTVEEYRSRLLGTRKNATHGVRHRGLAIFMRLPKEIKLPESIDWREKGVVTPVKNQGQCGSCWSFSATGALEGQHARASGKLVSLSEQQLVDCSKKFDNNGCNGGLMDNAFKYVQEIGGLETEETYPYKGHEGKCKFNKALAVVTCSGYVDIPSQDENALKEALATIGPVSVAIDATEEKFMLYKEGVFVDDTCESTDDALNHGVLAVGYGIDEKTKTEYWIVKNSWGPSWGEEGYIRMGRIRGSCGIATSASYPLVK